MVFNIPRAINHYILARGKMFYFCNKKNLINFPWGCSVWMNRKYFNGMRELNNFYNVKRRIWPSVEKVPNFCTSTNTLHNILEWLKSRVSSPKNASIFSNFHCNTYSSRKFTHKWSQLVMLVLANKLLCALFLHHYILSHSQHQQSSVQLTHSSLPNNNIPLIMTTTFSLAFAML